MEGMEHSPDVSLPPSREPSPRRPLQPQLEEGAAEGAGGVDAWAGGNGGGGGDSGSARASSDGDPPQQQQQLDGEAEEPSVPLLKSETDAETADAGGGGAAEEAGAGAAGPGSGSASAQDSAAAAADNAGDAGSAEDAPPAAAAEPPEGERGGTGLGSEVSAGGADAGGGSNGGGDAVAAGMVAAEVEAEADATAAAAAAAVAAAAAARGGSPSRSAGGSRGLLGVRGTSKSFTAGRESPNRNLRSRGFGSLAVVREYNSRTPSAHSSRPASSVLAASSVPPSPDVYGSEPPSTALGTSTMGMVVGPFSPWHAGPAAPMVSGVVPSLDDVEVRGAAMQLRTNSVIVREGHRASGAVGRGFAAADSAMPSTPPTPRYTAARSASEAPQHAAAAAAEPPPPPSPLGTTTADLLPLSEPPEPQDSGQQVPSSNSVPSMAFGSSPAVPQTSARNRPLVMPFLERQSIVATIAGAAGTAAAVAAAGPAPAAGRRQGLQGNIRHGSAFLQQPLLSGSTSLGSGPKDSVASGYYRPSVTKGLMSPADSPFPSRTPAATAEGAPPSEELPLPVYPGFRSSGGVAAAAASGAGNGGYAAGGGAAAAKAAAAAAASGRSSATSADLQHQQQLMLGEAISIRAIHKSGLGPGPGAGGAADHSGGGSVSVSGMGMGMGMGMGGGGMGLAGVPGRRGRRLPAHPTASATAAAMASYFAGVEAAIADGGAAADKALLPSGLARRLRAARMMANGPPPFQRRSEPPPPPSPSGIKLDGFMLLEAADEEMPEAVQFASLQSRHISAVESADLLYFLALRILDVSDNKLPDLVCLATLQALVRLRAASCLLTTLGPWPGGSLVGGGGAAAGGAGAGWDSGGGGEGAQQQRRASGAAGVLRRSRTRIARGESGGSSGTTELGEAYDSWTVGPEGGAQQQGEAALPLQRASSIMTSGGGAAAAAAGSISAAASAVNSGRATAENAARPAAAAADTSAAPSAQTTAAAAAALPESLVPESLVAALLAPLNVRPFQFLEVLDLSYNQLQPHMVLLPGSPLTLLPRLAELDLSSNHLKHLPTPAEMVAAAAKVAAAAALSAAGAAGGAAAGAVAAAAATGGVSFPALRRLRLAHNGLKSAAIASLVALAPPCLTHLDLSHNAITEAPRLKARSASLSALLPATLTTEESAESFATSASGNGGVTVVSAAALGLRSLGQAAGRAAANAAGCRSALKQQQPQRGEGGGTAAAAAVAAAVAERYRGMLTRLTVLDLSYNRVATEGAVQGLLHLPALQRLLLAGNPLTITAQRARAAAAAAAAAASSSPSSSAASKLSSKMDFGEPDAPPARPSVAASLTSRFARIPETSPKQQSTTLAAAAAATITAAAAPERVAEAYDRLDATIEQWRLNTVMEEDEEEDEEEDGEEELGSGDDRTFLTGVGIQERRLRKNSAAAALPLEAVAGADDGVGTAAAPEATAPPPPPATEDEAPLWECITDPTERMAVALGLDPLTLPMHTGALTTDSAGAIAALRFALAHPLVEANDGLAPHPGYAAATAAAQLKRKQRRPAPTQRLAPMAAASAAAAAATTAAAAGRSTADGPKAAKILTVEAMLEGMKGKLAALEASLAAQLAAAPSTAAAAARRAADASRGRYGAGRRGNELESEDGGGAGGDDDAGSNGSGLPEDVIDQIERESESEADDEDAVDAEMGQMDPKQGIVLLADQLMAEEVAADERITAIGNANGNGNIELSQSMGRTAVTPSPTVRVTVTVSTSPPQQVPPPTRSAVSPTRRLGTAPSGGSVGGGAAGGGGGSAGSPRKGVSIASASSTVAQVSASPVVLPGGAASALGYAS